MERFSPSLSNAGISAASATARFEMLVARCVNIRAEDGVLLKNVRIGRVKRRCSRHAGAGFRGLIRAIDRIKTNLGGKLYRECLDGVGE